MANATAKEMLAKLLPFEHLLTNTVEELRAVRVRNKDLESKLKMSIKDKHDMELSMDSIKTSHQEVVLKSQAEFVAMKHNYEIKLMDTREERVANRLIIETLSNESKLLKEEINKLILNKLTAENKVDELEIKLQTNEFLQEGVLNKARSVKKLVEETECKYREAIEAQLKIQSSVQQAHSVCVTVQREYQTGKDIIIHLDETNRGLRKELIALRSEIIAKAGTKRYSTDRSTENWTLAKDFERQSKIIENLRTQVDEQKICLKDLSNFQYETQVLLEQSAAREKSLNERLGQFRDDASCLKSQVNELTEQLTEFQQRKSVDDISELRKPEIT